MGTDRAGIIREVAAFYDFTGKSVIVAGAGGGRLIDYLQSASRVIAVDDDAEATRQLGEMVRARALGPRFELVQAEFRTVLTPADTVVLEFCLHEMADPKQALDHARTLAPDVIVIDHASGIDVVVGCGRGGGCGVSMGRGRARAGSQAARRGRGSALR